MKGQASRLAGVSPYDTACSAWTFGAEMYRSHMYAQFGCLAWAASIHVSTHPVAPSRGIRSLTGAWSAFKVLSWRGQAAPTTAFPFLNRSTSSEERAQYLTISGRCCLSSVA